MPSLGGPLPAIQAGALPRLEALRVSAPELRSALPPSWAQLPALRSLAVVLGGVGPLPAEWQHGFVGLEELSISAPLAPRVACDHPPRAEGQQGSRPLPEAWPASLQELRSLTLSGLGLTGSIPLSWSLEGFPSLVHL